MFQFTAQQIKRDAINCSDLARITLRPKQKHAIAVNGGTSTI
ncbi:hypothetical protein OLL86_07480 [Gallibacterium anatis]|nr:hypothetical protein [Gallibacterium anatis]UZD15371.1 hypothetical protein OLL86_07480 [Gallibacterium anatis]